ncbi:MAG: hypothetical protein P8K79_08710 [Mariniblastus sp.]|jgi:hypothetical protein|nr:hypothetical protein [Mariniblastus sp.]
MLALKWLYLAVGISYVILINTLMVDQYFNHQYLPFLPENLDGNTSGIVPAEFKTHLIGISYLGGMIGATFVLIVKGLVATRTGPA